MNDINKLIDEIEVVLAGKILEQEKLQTEVMEMNEGEVSPNDIMHLLVSEGRINDAEDLVFRLLEIVPNYDLISMGLDFFRIISEKTDEQLEELNYSREEVFQGLLDLKRIFDSLL